MAGTSVDVVMQNLSRGGIGLRSRTPLNPGEYYVAIFSLKQGGRKKVEIKLVRSCACGDGWYEAGAQFVNLAEEHVPVPPRGCAAPNAPSEGDFVAPSQL